MFGPVQTLSRFLPIVWIVRGSELNEICN